MSTTSPHWSTEPFAEVLPRLNSEQLREGAQIYRDSSDRFPKSYGTLIYAIAEALDYIAFLKDTKGE